MAETGDPVGSITEELGLLERHVSILKTVRDNQPVGLIRLSEMTGIPKHKVRYSLKLLEKEGIIRATTEGAVVTDSFEPFMESMRVHLDDITREIERIVKLL